MKLFNRVALGLLWIGCSVPISAGIVAIDNIAQAGDCTSNQGGLPATAQTIWSNSGTDSVDGIFGNIANPNCSDMFRIWISDPLNFTATVAPGQDAVAFNPQIFLFDGAGLLISGAFGFVANATLPFGPSDPGFYFLLINSLANEPSYTVTAPNGTTQKVGVGCGMTTQLSPSCSSPTIIGFDDGIPEDRIIGLAEIYPQGWFAPPDGSSQPIDSYPTPPVLPDGSTGIIQSGGLQAGSGTYVVEFTGVEGVNPEPGTVILMLSGLAAVVALARKKRA